MTDTTTPEPEETPAEVIATLRASGWDQEDLEAVPHLRNLLDEANRDRSGNEW